MKKTIERETSKHFDKISDVWENKIWVNWKEFDDKIISFASLQGDEIALDVGTGTGALASKFKVKEMYGLDISREMLEKNRLPRHRRIVGSGTKIPYLNNTFDFVTARNVLKHTHDPKRILQEMHRVLKPGKKILIIESAPLSIDHVEIPTKVVRVVEPYHPRFRTDGELIGLVKEIGFKDIETDIEIIRKKWLERWCQAKKATHEQRLQIFNLYKNAPESFKEGQHVELFEDEVEILNDFPWVLIKGVK